MMKRITYYFTVLLFLSPCAMAANWDLDKQSSELTYLSNKMLFGSHASVYEHNNFKMIDGSIEENGSARLVIDMNSVDTKVQIRDERVKEHVFKVSKYPQAVVQVNLKDQSLSVEQLPLHQTQTREIRGELTMVGATHAITGEVAVTRLGKDKLVLQTTKPLLLDARLYGMAGGFEILRGLVKLFNIPTTIPVSFNLVFVRGQAK